MQGFIRPGRTEVWEVVVLVVDALVNDEEDELADEEEEKDDDEVEVNVVLQII